MLAGWDQLVMMPAGRRAARGHQIGTLARIVHEHATSPEIGEWLAELDEREVSELERDIVRLARRDWERARRVPTDLAAELSKAHSDGQESWQAARAADDFEAFAPALERNIELARAYGACLDEEGQGVYQSLVDDFDFGLRTDELRRLFCALGKRLAPLVEEARAHAPVAPSRRCPRTSSARRRVDHAARRRRRRELAPGRLGAPLLGLDGARDQRMTTRYNDGGIESLLSSLHEFGHALYERQIDPELDRTNLGTGTSMSIHESQSKLWENHVARHPAFAAVLAEELAAGGYEIGARAAARGARRGRAVVDPRLRRPADLPAAHRAALRARARADRRRPRRRRSARGVAGRDDAAARPRSAQRRARLPAGRALERGRVRLLPELRDGLPDRSLAVGGDGARGVGPREERSARADVGPIKDWLAPTCTATGAASTRFPLVEQATGRGLEIESFLRYVSPFASAGARI